MKGFFHIDLSPWIRSCKKSLLILLFLSALFSLAGVFILIITLGYTNREDFAIYIYLWIFASVFIGVTGSVWILAKYQRLKIRHSRYTYLDILPKDVVISQYTGEYNLHGEKVIFRQLTHIKFDKTTSFALSKEGELLIKGDIRHYHEEEKSLRYTVVKGNLQFNNWWLNENRFTTKQEFIIPRIFGNQKRIYRNLKIAYKRFSAIIPKKPLNYGVLTGKKLKKRHQFSDVKISTYNRNW